MKTRARQTTPAQGMALGMDASEISDDLAYGLIVIITFRWILVSAGLFFSLWNPGPLSQLRLAIVVILGLAVLNFYLHSQLLMRRPAPEKVAYAASAGDIAVITFIVLAQGGFESGTYIFYYPAILVVSVAFQTSVTFIFTAVTIALYALISSATANLAGVNQQILITRLLMLAAVGVCGNLYWRIERNRRQAAREAREALMAEIRQHGASLKQ